MGLKNTLSLTRDHTMWGLVDTILTLLVVVGLALNAWGIVMNAVVVEANDGVMPVIFDQPALITTDYGTPRRFVHDGKLLFLADTIAINFPNLEKYIPEGRSGNPITWWGKWLDYPFEGGLNLVSIGDISRWVGSLLFLTGNMLLIPCILRRLFFSGKPS